MEEEKQLNIQPLSDDEKDEVEETVKELTTPEPEPKKPKRGRPRKYSPQLKKPKTTPEERARLGGKKSQENRRKEKEKLKLLETKLDSRLDDELLIDRISTKLFEKMSSLKFPAPPEKEPEQPKITPTPTPRNTPTSSFRPAEKAGPTVSSRDLFNSMF